MTVEEATDVLAELLAEDRKAIESLCRGMPPKAKAKYLALVDYREAALATLRDVAHETQRLREALRGLHSEVDCRIEHGAESGGHLEYVRYILAALGEPGS